MTDEQTTSARSRLPSWWTVPTARPVRPTNPGADRTRKVIVAVAVVALIGALTAVWIERSRSHSIKGAIDVGTIQIGSACRLAPRYRGIREGTTVVVRDAHGVVVGTSALGPGANVGPYCEFLFSVRVPNRDLYTIEVDHRGGVTYSKAYLDFFHWRAGMALRGARMTWL